MTLLSILGCKIFQDEIVWLLSNDPQVEKIIISENDSILEFTEKLDEQHTPYSIVPFEKIPHVLENVDKDKLTVVVNLLELGLHWVPNDLKLDVYDAIKKMTPYSNGILVFYGLCGNVLGKIEEDFNQEKDTCVVRILRDDDDRIVDDCIAATVGGCAKYLKLLTKHGKEPAFLFTPMYAQSWREVLKVHQYDSDPEESMKMAKMINDASGYKRVAKVNTGLEYVKDIDKKIEEFAELFGGYDIFELEGHLDIFEKCYLSIKDEMNRNN